MLELNNNFEGIISKASLYDIYKTF